MYTNVVLWVPYQKKKRYTAVTEGLVVKKYETYRKIWDKRLLIELFYTWIQIFNERETFFNRFTKPKHSIIIKMFYCVKIKYRVNKESRPKQKFTTGAVQRQYCLILVQDWQSVQVLYWHLHGMITLCQYLVSST